MVVAGMVKGAGGWRRLSWVRGFGPGQCELVERLLLGIVGDGTKSSI